MFETYEYSDKKKEKEKRKQQFSVNYFGVLLTLGLNLLFYVIALVGAFSLKSGNLMIATWPIAGVLLVEVIFVGLAAIFEIVKPRSVQNLFKASIFKSVARLSGFLVGIGLIVYGVIAGREQGPQNAVAYLTSTYGGVAIIFGLPMFIWSILHLSTASQISKDVPHAYKKEKDDDVVVDAEKTSSETANEKSNSTQDAIEVEVHDINEA